MLLFLLIVQDIIQAKTVTSVIPVNPQLVVAPAGEFCTPGYGCLQAEGIVTPRQSWLLNAQGHRSSSQLCRAVRNTCFQR